MSDSLIALVVGLAAGTHTATWGMFKDSPHEGFTWLRWSRSMILSAIIAPMLQLITRLDMHTAPGLAVLFGITYVGERICTEFYKTFVREEDQSKYAIPMQFAVKGRVVHDRRTRHIVAACVTAVAILLTVGVVFLERSSPGAQSLLATAAIGSLGGWFSAVGGAWKDAPIEGFSAAKFVRSPLVAVAWALLLSQFTDNLLMIGFGALGYTIATLETYKTFFFPNEPRGKFGGKPVIRPDMLVKRWRFVPVYAAIWLAVLTTIVIGLSEVL